MFRNYPKIFQDAVNWLDEIFESSQRANRALEMMEEVEKEAKKTAEAVEELGIAVKGFGELNATVNRLGEEMRNTAKNTEELLKEFEELTRQFDKTLNQQNPSRSESLTLQTTKIPNTERSNETPQTRSESLTLQTTKIPNTERSNETPQTTVGQRERFNREKFNQPKPYRGNLLTPKQTKTTNTDGICNPTQLGTRRPSF
jgi:hypothetical protein